MPSFPVSEKKIQDLDRRMRLLGIKGADLKESFVRSSGPGGQNVNKVSTCVVLVHVPSGTTVRCQQERSQSLNRFFARRQLVEKLEREKQGRESEAARNLARIRKQKKKRSKKAKRKLLQLKKERSQIKSFRQRVRPPHDGE